MRVPREVCGRMAAVKGALLRSVCIVHVSGEDVPGTFEKPCVRLFGPRGRWAPAKNGFLIPKTYLYAFALIQHWVPTKCKALGQTARLQRQTR